MSTTRPQAVTPSDYTAAERRGWRAAVSVSRGKQPVNPYKDPIKRDLWNAGFRSASRLGLGRQCGTV